MAGNLDDLVSPAAEPDVAVFVDCGGVAREIHGLSGDTLPIIPCVALRIAPDRGSQAREWPRDDKDPFLVRTTRRTLRGHHARANPGHRNAARARLGR